MFTREKTYTLIAVVLGCLILVTIFALAVSRRVATDERNECFARMGEQTHKADDCSIKLREALDQLSGAKQTIDTLSRQIQQVENDQPRIVAVEPAPAGTAKNVAVSMTNSKEQPLAKRCSGGTDKSPETSANREKLIKKLITNGIFKSHRLSSVASDMAVVVVTPIFMSLDYEDKLAFVSVVYAHYFDGCSKDDSVTLRYSATNKTIGTFNLEWGLQLKD